MNLNLSRVFVEYIRLLRLPITRNSVNEYLSFHPYPNSLLALVDIMAHFRIDRAALEVPFSEANVLPLPLFAHLQRNQEQIVLVSQITPDSIEWFDPDVGWQRGPREEISKSWTGKVLICEPSAESGEKYFRNARWREGLANSRIILAFILTALVLGTLLYLSESTSMALTGLGGLKAIGMILSILIWAKSNSIAGPASENWCRTGAKINCNKVMNSAGARLNSWLSWADVGLLYFVGTSILLGIFLMTGDNMNGLWNLHLLFGIGFACFSTYSIYYQARILRNWCTLCLGIIALGLMEFLITLYTLSGNWALTPINLGYVSVAFALPVIILLLINPLAKKAGEQPELKAALRQLRARPDLFHVLIHSFPIVEPIPPELPFIPLGNQNSNMQLAAFLSPTCAPCLDTYLQLAELVDEISIKVYLRTEVSPDSNGFQFTKLLYGLKPPIRGTALDDWFVIHKGNLKRWKTKYSIDQGHAEFARIQLQLNSWMETSGIDRVPMLVYKDRVIPPEFKPADFIHALRYQTEIPLNYGFADHL